jgi:nicotinate phosphoribosyltransferase
MPVHIELPVEKIRSGYYSDIYFPNTGKILEWDGHHPKVVMQVFQKSKDAVLCGMEAAVQVIEKCCLGDPPEIRALDDGDIINGLEWRRQNPDVPEPVMHIEGGYQSFAHLETIYLGFLSRSTRIATNTRKVVDAANGKPILFFPARFDALWVQSMDGYAAHIGGAIGVSTEAQASWWGSKAVGTMPHALIAAYGGDTVKATLKFAEWRKTIGKDPNGVISLVDFDNDCIGTSLKVARAMRDAGYNLHGVRFDTSGNLVDRSVQSLMGLYKCTGTCHKLVDIAREAFDKEGFKDLRIFVSGGFGPEKIRFFEEVNIPVDGYGVGSTLLHNFGDFDFTADIVKVDGKPCAKVGRCYVPNPRFRKW